MSEARQQLMAQIVDRVFVYDDRVIAVALRPGFGVILNVPQATPDQVMTVISRHEKRHNQPDGQLYPERGRRASLAGRHNIALLPPLRAWWKGMHLKQ
jgi:hypothetical protein